MRHSKVYLVDIEGYTVTVKTKTPSSVAAADDIECSSIPPIDNGNSDGNKDDNDTATEPSMVVLVPQAFYYLI